MTVNLKRRSKQFIVKVGIVFFIVLIIMVSFLVHKDNEKQGGKNIRNNKTNIKPKQKNIKEIDYIEEYIEHNNERMNIDDYNQIYCMLPFINDGFHNSKVLGLFYDNKFDKLITLAKDRTIKFWDISNEKAPVLLFTKFIDYSYEINTSDYSNKSGILAIRKNNGRITLHDLKNRREIFINVDNINKLSFSRDGKILAGGFLNGKIIIWYYLFSRRGAWAFGLRRHPKNISDIIFTEDRFVSTSEDGTLLFYKFKKNTFQKREIFKFIRKNKEKEGVKKILFSETNNSFFVLTNENSIMEYDKDGNLIDSFIKFKTPINEISISPSGRAVIAGDTKGKLYIVDIKTRAIIKEWKVLRGEVDKIKIIKKNNEPLIIVCGGAKNEMGFYNFSGERLSRVYGIGNRVYTVGIDKNYRIGFTVNPPLFGGNLQYFDYFFDLKKFIISPADDSSNFVRESKRTGIYKVKRFNFNDMPILKAFASDVLIIKKGERNHGLLIKTRYDGRKHTSFTFLNSKYIASGGEDGTILIYDLTGNVRKRLFVSSDKISSLATSKDGKYLIISTMDKKIIVWKLKEILPKDEMEKEIWATKYFDRKFEKYFTEEEFNMVNGFYDEVKNETPFIYESINNYIMTFILFYRTNYFEHSYYDLSFRFMTIIPVVDNEWIAWTQYGIVTSSIYLWSKIGYIVNADQSVVWDLPKIYKYVYQPDIIKKEFVGENIRKKYKKKRELFEPAYHKLNKVVERNGMPHIEIIYPKNGAVFNNREITVTVRAINKGGGISDIRLFHNGKLVGSEGIYNVCFSKSDFHKYYCSHKKILFDKEEGVFKLSDIDKKTSRGLVTREFKIKLIPGTNIISCDAKGNFPVYPALETKTVKITYKTDIVKDKKRIYILAIGEQNFKNSRLDLRYPHNDIEKLVQVFQYHKSNEYEFYQIIKLFNANKQTIISNLMEIQQEIRSKDIFVFYISSHGVVKCGNLYIPTANFDKRINMNTTISSFELLEWSKLIPSVNQLFILDTCFSGAFAEKFSDVYQNNISVLMTGNGMHLMASTTPKGFALEGYNSHGFFTNYLIEALTGSADSNNDQRISLKEVSEYVKKELGKKRIELQKYGVLLQEPVIAGCGKDIVLTEIK